MHTCECVRVLKFVSMPVSEQGNDRHTSRGICEQPDEGQERKKENITPCFLPKIYTGVQFAYANRTPSTHREEHSPNISLRLVTSV